MKLTRREFIRASAASAAWMLGANALAADKPKAAPMPFKNALIPRKARSSTPAKGEWIASTCQGCTQWCAIQLYVSGGRATRVRGNEISKSNHGYVCPRGHLIPQQTYDPDRVKVPLKRTNPLKGRGIDPKFVPISWDEAMNIVADKMLELRNAGEPEKLMYMRGRYGPLSQELLYGTLPKIFGTGQYFSHSAICAEAEKMGPGLTQGFYGYRDYDLEKTNCLVIWGCDPLASNRQVPNTIHRFHEIVARGTVIAVDPRLSNAAAKAHEWLPVKPGTDGALAGAIAHVILTEGLWNREFVGDFKDGKNLFVAGEMVDEAAFVEKETSGLVKWWNLELKDRTPAFGEKESLIPADQILRVARAMGKAAPNTAVWMGPGAAMMPRGTYAAMAVYALNGLMGSIDVVVLEGAPGAPLNKFPSTEKFIDEVAKKGSKTGKKLDGRGEKNMPALMGSAMNNVPNNLLKDPGAVKVMLASWNNYNHSATGASRWDEVMAKVPFFAHMVTNPSEMTQFADIVLPSTHNTTEGWNIITNGSNGYSYASIQQNPIKRVFDVKQEENEVVWLLAQKLKAKGFPNLADYYDTIKDPETGKAATNELEFAEITTRFLSAPIWMAKEAPKGDAQIKGWAEFKAKGMFHGPRYTPKKGWGGKFKSETRKFEFYSATLKKRLGEHAKKHETTTDDILTVSGYTARGDLAFVPHYEVPKRNGSLEEFPFTFIDYKSRLNREGRSQNLPWYQEFKKVDPGDVSWGDVVKMNPADGARLGLKTGDKVTITSQAGSITVDLKLWEGVRPGTVAKCYGQGHWAYGRVATKDYAKAVPLGGNNNTILVDDLDRLSGSTARNGGFTGVRITKA
ncbi:molybdopterin-dependent oxidoreductase [Sulfuritalea hydrogenivorans]|jgi:anaerobic selenocysteine-containing dehydrogenase|uniref:Molybdopterin oxidoreductase, ArrA like protein n=1 Tax=Sulfuritalea hydrogenivorans sk43H TaxID=1223802 RepID=W0SB60_9PROT|nr:molybdopterin-dependent oxidoreductase [Sulfuritalea hydrogenivorans]BAO28251.1 molybdopterin oxidoreductase, ArrA like protein [Sulfuritalea hydrogenivorans sk43H]